MIILPAIDILNGDCVRLQKGEFSTAHKVFENPIAAAARFEQCGAEWVHMVDLDGAKNGEPANFDIICTVAKETKLKVEVGGGIRSINTVAWYLKAGVSRIVLGSAALQNPDFVKEAVREYGDYIAVGIDAKNGKVSISGWRETSETDYIEFACQMEDIGVKYLIFTDIARDGMLTGPNFDALDKLQSSVSCNIIASGGIKNTEHIVRLNEMGLYGAICGKSIYSGTLQLEDALQVVK